jgi:FkbM family methyltransferase
MKTYKTKYGLITLRKNEIYIGNEFNNERYWYEDTLIKLKKYINPRQNILEIGGHCGTSSIVYSSFLDNNSKVIVYEPQENMYELLVENINQNNLQNKIIPNKKGVFCYEGEGNMNDIDIDGGGGNVLKRYTEEKHLPCNFGGLGLGFKGEKIQLTTIDNMNLENIGFIHCHAQGSENYIFSNSTNLILKYKPFILYRNVEKDKYLYENVSKAYPQYKNDSEFNIKNYCIEKLNYSFIDNFNNSVDILLIPPQNNFDKIIHITRKEIDDKLLKSKQLWETLNPEYKIELYNDNKCVIFLKKYFGDKYVDIFNFIKDGPIKADFFRACVLYIYGGIYVDADIVPFVSLNQYVDDDVELMTCISYNYNDNQNTFCYNPQFIVSKKYSDEIFKIIESYQKKYDDRDSKPYTYWSWSICNIFNKIYNFEVKIDNDNVFILNNKKYKFIIEEIFDKNTSEIYNFINFSENKDMLLKNKNLDIYCKFKGQNVLNNFNNK